jgi:hypothetical protein
LVQPVRPAVTLAQLRILQGPPDVQGTTLDLARPTTVVGRAPHLADIDFYADDERSVISRRHCTLQSDGISFTITDHSANGTSVNGQRLAREVPTPLNDGDEVMLGSAADQLGVKFSFSNLIGKTQMWTPGQVAGAQAGARSEAARPGRAEASRAAAQRGGAAKAGASRPSLLVGGLILAMVLVLCCAGAAIAGWFIFSGRTPLYSPQPSATVPPPSPTATPEPSDTPTARPTNTPAPTATSAPTDTPAPPTAPPAPTDTPVPVSKLCPPDKPTLLTGSLTFEALTIGARVQACGDNQACVAATFANTGGDDYVIQVDRKSYGAGKATILQGKGFAFVTAAEPEGYAVYVSVPAKTASLPVCLQFGAPAAEAKTLIFQWVAKGTASGASLQVPLKAP